MEQRSSLFNWSQSIFSLEQPMALLSVLSGLWSRTVDLLSAIDHCSVAETKRNLVWLRQLNRLFISFKKNEGGDDAGAERGGTQHQRHSPSYMLWLTMTHDDSSRVQKRLSSLVLVRVHHATGPCQVTLRPPLRKEGTAAAMCWEIWVMNYFHVFLKKGSTDAVYFLGLGLRVIYRKGKSFSGICPQ